MLIQFTFKNFKSFRDENTLFMTATDTNDICELYSRVGQYKLLPVTGIFGANASGKSNVLEALRYMHNYVIYSFGYEDNISTDILDEANKFSYRSKNTQIPFLLDKDSADQESLFEIIYTDENDSCRTYKYGFTVKQNIISNEWLEYKSKTGKKFNTVFNRKDNNFNGIKDKNDKIIIVKTIKPQSLILSTGAKLNIPIIQNVYKWFTNNVFINFGEPFENLAISEITKSLINKEYTTIDKLIDYIKSFDPSIINFEIDTNSNKNIYCIHNEINSNEKIRIPYYMESDGTKKMISLFFCLYDIINKGNILFIDELNAKLHPLLVRNILILFYNKETNPNNAQLIFTSHDTWMMKNDSLRNDEIWFTNKDNNGISSLYSLSDFKINEEINHDKEEYYLLGAFDAIPELKPINLLDSDKK